MGRNARCCFARAILCVHRCFVRAAVSRPAIACPCAQVGGTHQLLRPGPLLHHTREQRATRARAPDLSLTFHVVGDLPWLESQLVGMPATVLQGEVVPASMLLVNRGRAPAGDILIRRCASASAASESRARDAPLYSAFHLRSISSRCLPSSRHCFVPATMPLIPLGETGGGGGNVAAGRVGVDYAARVSKMERTTARCLGSLSERSARSNRSASQGCPKRGRLPKGANLISPPPSG